MKKNKILILIIGIILIFLIIFFSLKLFKTEKTEGPNIITGEIIEVIEKGYKIEVDNLNESDTFTEVIVHFNNIKFKEKDYIKVTGNNYNSKKKSFDATEIVKTSYIEEYSPTIKSKELGIIQAQYGYILTLDKIELSEIETRLYVTLLNLGESKIDLSLENSIITQNEKEYKYQPNLKAKYIEVGKQLSPTKESSGIITFPKLETEIVKIKLKVISNNKEEILEEFIFEVGL